MSNDALTAVGEYTERFNELTGQNIPCGAIFQSAGLEVHIRKHHPNIVTEMDKIPAILSTPDYVGQNPKEPNSIEVVKRLAANLMVCVKLDLEKGYLYVASLYDITDAKLEKRLKTGRLKPYK